MVRDRSSSVIAPLWVYAHAPGSPNGATVSDGPSFPLQLPVLQSHRIVSDEVGQGRATVGRSEPKDPASLGTAAHTLAESAACRRAVGPVQAREGDRSSSADGVRTVNRVVIKQ